MDAASEAFVGDHFTCGRRFRILRAFDDCTRECPALMVDTPVSGRDAANLQPILDRERVCEQRRIQAFEGDERAPQPLPTDQIQRQIQRPELSLWLEEKRKTGEASGTRQAPISSGGMGSPKIFIHPRHVECVPRAAIGIGHVYYK